MGCWMPEQGPVDLRATAVERSPAVELNNMEAKMVQGGRKPEALGISVAVMP